MIAVDPDFERIHTYLDQSAGPDRTPLATWVVHRPDCLTAGAAGLTCTCGLFHVLNQSPRTEWERDLSQDQLKQLWLAFNGHIAHHGHCDAQAGKTCSCGLHRTFPLLFRS